MDVVASQITSLTIVYSTVYSGTDLRKHQSSASLVFVREFTGDRWILRAKRASNAENVSIWWRHHVDKPPWKLYRVWMGDYISLFYMDIIINPCPNSVAGLTNHVILDLSDTQQRKHENITYLTH